MDRSMFERSEGSLLIGVVGVFLVLTWIFTLLRLYVRGFMTKANNLGTDDYLLISALITFSACCVCVFLGVSVGGIGRSLADINSDRDSLDEVSKGLLLWWLFELLYAITTVLIRCSIATFLLRICKRKAHTFVIYGTISVVLAFSTFYIFLLMFQCRPVHYYWTRYSPGTTGTCIDPNIVPSASYAHSVVSATADWILGVLPIWLIWDLNMRLRTKVSLAILLGFGTLAGAAAIIRIPYIYDLARTTEFFKENVKVIIWSTVETGLGMIATAASVLRPLFTKFHILSGSSSNHPNLTTNNVQGTWRPRSKSLANKGPLDSNGIEMYGVDTTIESSQEGHRGGKRDGGRKTLSSTQPNREANESEEELTKKGSEIWVTKTIHA